MGRRAQIALSPSMLKAARSPKPYTLVAGGYGSGKTELLLRLFLRRLEQNYRFRTRKSPSLFLSPTYDMVHRQIVPRLHDLLKGVGLEPKWSDQERFLLLPFRGFKTYSRFASAENYLRILGSNTPDIQVDEVDIMFRGNVSKQESMWERLISRTRVPGASNSIDLACTPEGHGFAYQKWDAAPKENEDLQQDYGLFQCPTYENARHLPADYIPRLIRSYAGNKQLIQAYLEGQFVNLKGQRVYYAFDRDRHGATGLRLVQGLPIEFSFDFNVNPCTCVVSQYREPDLVVVACIQDRSGRGTVALCERVLERFGHHQGPAFIYGDATSVRRQSSSGGKSDRSIIDSTIGRAWAQRGYEPRWTKTNPWVPDRYASVNGIFLDDRCVVDLVGAKALVDDFIQGAYKEGTREENDLGGKIGHASSALGYRIHRDFPVARTIEDRERGVAYGAAA